MTPRLRFSAPRLRYSISEGLANGSDAAPISVTLPAGTSFVEFYVAPGIPYAAHIGEIVIPGATAGDLLLVLYSDTAFLHDTARRSTPAAYGSPGMGRLALRPTDVTTYVSGADTFHFIDGDKARVIPLLRDVRLQRSLWGDGWVQL